MSATNKDSVLRSLDLDAALVESLPEAVWSELIGFLEDDHQLIRESSEADGSPPEALTPALFRSSRLG